MSSMKKILKNAFCTGFLAIVMVSGFFHYNQLEHYQSDPPPHIGTILEPFSERGVHIRAKAYNAEESRAYLKRNLLSKGVVPIQMTIQNNTGESYILSKNGLDLDELSAGAVAHTVNRNYIPRSIAFKIAAFFFWPFIIPSAIDTVLTLRYHFELKRDYAAKSVKEEGEVLLPYSTTHRVIFVRNQHLTQDFTLYLQDLQSGRYSPYPTKIEMS